MNRGWRDRHTVAAGAAACAACCAAPLLGLFGIAVGGGAATTLTWCSWARCSRRSSAPCPWPPCGTNEREGVSRQNRKVPCLSTSVMPRPTEPRCVTGRPERGASVPR